MQRWSWSMALLAAFVCGLTHAHPGVGYNLRALHVAHDAEGATVYMRLTLPLVVASKLGDAKSDGTYVPAPYTYNRLESGRVFHYLDFAALRGDGGSGLGELVAAGHELRAGERIVTPQVLAVRVHVKGSVPAFDTFEEARAALAGALSPVSETEIDTGYVLVDAALRYAHAGGLLVYSLRSTLIPGELGEPLTRNIVWDHRDGQTDIYQCRGLLEHAWMIDPNATPVTEAHRSKDE